MPESPSSAAGQQYRICVADTPGKLEDQVTKLLSDGWELHGYPFVTLQFGSNGNGHGPSGNLVCQAMVRPAEHIAPELASKTSRLAPVRSLVERPRVAPSIRNVSIFLAVLAGGSLLLDCLLFRSGFYVRYLEPDSSTGSLERAFQGEMNRAPSHKKEVLIVGSSRLAEGFSAKIANLYKPEDGFRFFNCAVPSAGPRSFYYLLRDLDPHRNRYAAIAIPIDDYQDLDDLDDVADRTPDLSLVINRLRFSDILPFTFSFTRWKTRRIVFRAALFKGFTYQRDLADFIEHPSERLARVRMFRKSGDGWAYDYGGIDHNLAGMTLDYATRRVTFPPGIPLDTRQFLEAAFFHQAEQRGRTRAFEVRWLGAIADQYRASKTRLIFFQAPRGPAPRPSPHLPWVSVDKLRQRPWVTIVDHQRFESLERPELFADHVHLSSDGRKVFTPMLVDAVKEIVH